MNKTTTTLFGLAICEAIAASFGILLSCRGNMQVFAGASTPSSYTATIDKDNRLLAYGMSDSFAFRLHNSEEFGYFVTSAPAWLDRNPTGEYSDYAFSWDNTDGSTYYFEVKLFDRGEAHSEIVEGKSRYLRGFPGAFKITTIYSKSVDTLEINRASPGTGWKDTGEQSIGDNLYKFVATKKASASSYSQFMSWSTKTVGVLYVKSITIEYTC